MKKKILFITGVALGHVGRCLTIANEVNKTGGILIKFACIYPGHGNKLITGKFPVYNIPYKERGDLIFAESLETCINSFQPDAIVLDLSPVPWLYQTKLPKIPTAYITNFFLTKSETKTTTQDIWFKKNEAMCNNSRKLRGMQKINNVRDLYEVDSVILADPTYFERTYTSYSNRHKFVGSCTWEPQNIPLDFCLKNKKIIYVSLGSTGTKLDFSASIAIIAQELEVKHIIYVTSNSAAKTQEVDGLIYHYYNKITASKILPFSELAITQGGAGSTYQALGHGIPVATYPSHINHRILAQHIHNSGMGFILSPKQKKTSLIKTIRNLASLKCYIHSNIESLSLTDGPHLAAQHVLKLLD